METNTEPCKGKESRLSQLPQDDFGAVRERRDFGPLEISLHPILPSPHRDFSFSCLTGWRYYPTSYQDDRLGIASSLEGRPSASMVIPDSWNDRVIDHSEAVESTRKLFEKLISLEQPKRRRIHRDESDFILENDDAMISPIVAVESLSKSTLPSTPSCDAQETPQLPQNETINIDEATVVTSSTCSTNRTSSSTDTKRPAVDLAGPDVIPKQELFFLYGKKPRKVQLKGSDYLTWDNGKPVQEVKFSAIFVCPITKELFLARSFGDAASFIKEGGIYWYPKKNIAEHAAAARAVDCWNLREGRHQSKRLSLDTPYGKGDVPELPINQLPMNIREKVLLILKEQTKLEVELYNKPKPRNRSPADPNRESHDNRNNFDRRHERFHNYRGRERYDQSGSACARDRSYYGQSIMQFHQRDAGRQRSTPYGDPAFNTDLGPRHTEDYNESTSQRDRGWQGDTIPSRPLQDRYMDYPTNQPPQRKYYSEEW